MNEKYIVKVSGCCELTDLGRSEMAEHVRLGGTLRELSDLLGVKYETVKQWNAKSSSAFWPEFNQIWTENLHAYRKELRMNQMLLSQTKAAMAIHLGKNTLDGQEDKPQEHNHTIRVIGTMPDYGATSAEWSKQFAPTTVHQLAQPKVINAEDVEVVERESGDEAE